MNDWRSYLLIMMAAWSTWYFSRLVWIGLRTGKLIDSKLADGRSVTREAMPIIFWFAMVFSAAFVPLFLWLIGLLVGDLAGFWEARF